MELVLAHSILQMPQRRRLIVRRLLSNPYATFVNKLIQVRMKIIYQCFDQILLPECSFANIAEKNHLRTKEHCRSTRDFAKSNRRKLVVLRDKLSVEKLHAECTCMLRAIQDEWFTTALAYIVYACTSYKHPNPCQKKVGVKGKFCFASKMVRKKLYKV